MRAYILIDVMLGEDIAISKTISKIDGISDVYPVAGPYDVIATADVANEKSLGEVVMKIRKIENVVSTLTLIAYL